MSENKEMPEASDEFNQLCKTRNEQGRIKHGDWHSDIPWEWAIWNYIEEMVDGHNYLMFANNSRNMTDDAMLFHSFMTLCRPMARNSGSSGAVALFFLNQYGDPEIVKQLKEGSFKPCPKKS